VSGVLARLLAHGWHRVYSARAFFVIRVKLAGPSTPDHVGDVVFRWANQGDLERLETLDAHGRGSTQRAYVAAHGDLLFVACHGDRIVATRRCSREIRDPLAARVVALRAGQLWGADVFCLPEYRSQGVGRRLALFADRQLASKGYTEVLATVEGGNVPSLRLSLRKGSELAYYVSYLRLPFYERLRISERMPRWCKRAMARRPV
jgi:GNAT superfamily N-acetyltransferase